jgi:membrane protein DedA with SNARE-associated domain
MDSLTNLEGAWAYIALFVTLYVSGAGMPLPEEFPLAFGGFMVAKGTCQLAATVIVITLALLTGDLTAYWLGHRFGMRVLNVFPFRYFCTPERIDKVTHRFRENQRKAIFFARFFAGIRLLTFLFAGMARVPLAQFVALDMLAACCSAPIPFVVGYWLGDFEKAIALARRIDFLIALAIAVGLIVTWYFWWRPRARRAVQANGQAPAAGDTVG